MSEQTWRHQVAASLERLMALVEQVQNVPSEQRTVFAEASEEVRRVLDQLQADTEGPEQKDKSHRARLASFVKMPQEILAATCKEDLLQRVVDAACELTGAGFGVAGYGYRRGSFQSTAISRAADGVPCLSPESTWIPSVEASLGLFEGALSIRLTGDQLRHHPQWSALAASGVPWRGLLAARLAGKDGKTRGLILVSDRVEGDFTAEDETVLVILGLIASLGMQHLETESDAQSWAEESAAIFASMADAVVVFDADCTPLRANPAARAILGLDAGDQNIETAFQALSIFYPDGRALGRDELPRQRALRGETVYNERLIMTNAKGKTLTVLTSASPVIMEGRLSRIVVVWHDITEIEQAVETVHHLRRRLREEQSFAGIVGRDPKMLEIFDTIRDLADVDAPVLIQGESGTGKELVAAAIHNEGPRANKRFIPVNCSALPETLLESELFGHIRGAFSGAIRDKRGRFELADGGTIFLDEVGDLSPTIQVKLLRVLQEGTFERVGSEKTVKVNVRVISATNKKLAEEVKKGNFREDLYYRLCVIPLYLPRLHDRRGDIPLLANHILKRALKERGGQEVFISHETLARMMDYHWPGNVRELQNFIHYALVKCKGDVLELHHFPSALSGTGAPGKRRRATELGSDAVHQALEQANGNKAAAARKLGISRVTFYRLLSRMRPQPRTRRSG